ncbi:MAG: GvpL/GvpF family gas vesicle protein [Candidatus Korobacteraceae bacterium]
MRASAHTQVLYLYAISRMPEGAAPAIAAEAIDGTAHVEAIRCGDYLCWVSRVSKRDFADQLNQRMQDLEWLATAGLRHQRVVGELSSHLAVLPARFGTVFMSEDSLAQHVRERKRALRTAFERVADADEWGIKIFVIAARKQSPVAKDASGSDYLKRKAQLLRPSVGKKLDAEVQEFIAALTKIAVGASPGGKASTGQPGLVWHGSFLVRRKDRKKLESALSKFATRWKDARRIDCTGPWPPYSFVGEHVQ